MKIFILGIVLLLCVNFFASCDKTEQINATTSVSDTIVVTINEAFKHKQPDFCLKIDSVLYDGRCPYGLQCFWEGNAVVRFKFTFNQKETIFFKLNTANSFRKDTIIQGVYFKLLELSPHPDIHAKYSYQSHEIKIYYSTLNQLK